MINKRLAPFVKDYGTDHTGLGRWSWYILEGAPGHKTRVITACAPCGDANSGESTVYAQHMNYIRHKGLRTDLKSIFRDDLLGALRIWRGNGERTIMMMDANEHVSDGKMCKQLRQSDIDMHPAVDTTTPGTFPNIWFRGKIDIDDIWISSNLEVIAASYLPFHGNIGDH